MFLWEKRKLSLNYTHHPFLPGVLNVVILFIRLAKAHIEASEFGSLVSEDMLIFNNNIFMHGDTLIIILPSLVTEFAYKKVLFK